MQYTLNYQNTTAFYTDGFDVYVISWPWVAVYCAAIGIMLIAAFCSIWCAYHTTIPDVLSYCSSLTRDSRFFDFAKRGSALDGAVRAKILRDVEVKLGEVVDPADEQLRNGFVNEVSLRPDDRYLAIAPPEYLRPPRRGFFLHMMRL